MYTEFDNIPDDSIIRSVVSRCSFSIFGKAMTIYCSKDKKYDPGRYYIQIKYLDFCIHNQFIEEWSGRKWYLSEHMTADEIFKTIYAACEAAVKHEIMEGFRIDNIRPFNPHVNIEELLKISHKEVTRK